MDGEGSDEDDEVIILENIPVSDYHGLQPFFLLNDSNIQILVKLFFRKAVTRNGYGAFEIYSLSTKIYLTLLSLARLAFHTAAFRWIYRR